jgi:hypothetical protein
MRFPTFEIAQVRHYASELRNGAFEGVSDHVEEVTGNAPDSFDTIANRYMNSPTSIARDMHAGSKFAALRLALRIATARAIDLDNWEQTRDYPLISNGLLAHENPDWNEAASRGQLALLPTDHHGASLPAHC